MTTYLDTLPTYEQARYADPSRAEPSNAPDAIKWSGKLPPPAIGEHVVIKMNRFGGATVTGYFIEHGWLGIVCRLDQQPEWHRKQGGDRNRALFFGNDL